MEKKQLAKIGLALLTAIIFLSSYYTLVNLNPSTTTPPTKAKTTTPPTTVYGVGYTNATISGYGETMNITISCSGPNSAATTSQINKIVADLEQNGSIYNTYAIGSNILAEAGSTNITSIYRYIYSKLNSTSTPCTNFSSSANLVLPNSVNLHVGSQSFNTPIPTTFRNQTLPTTLESTMPKSIPVKISALVTLNGTIYSLNATNA